MHFTTERSFIASEDIPAGARVKYIGNNQVALADNGDIEIGCSKLQSGKDVYSMNTPVAVRLRLPATTFLASGAFADGVTLKRGDGGKVSDAAPGAACAIALEAAGADGDMIEAIPL